MSIKPRAFTKTFSGKAREIITEIEITIPWTPQVPYPKPATTHKFMALWDTGATNTCISKNVVDALGIKPSGIAPVTTPSLEGTEDVDLYHINMILPNKLERMAIPVANMKLTGFDVLIGMDIISVGDFSLSTNNGNTVFSFMLPSQKHIDFTQSPPIVIPDITPTPKQRPNDDCACGSGERYKRCCGYKGNPKNKPKK